MHWLKRNLKEKIVYWRPPTRDGFGGFSWSSPLQIEGKWEDRASNIFDPSGKEVVSNAIVWVDLNLEIGGYLW